MAPGTFRSEDGKLRFQLSDKYIVDHRITRYCPEVLNEHGEVIHTLRAHPSFDEAMKDIRKYVMEQSRQHVKVKDVKLYWVYDEIDAVESDLSAIYRSLSDLTLVMHRQNAIDMEGVIKRVRSAIDDVMEAKRELVRASEV